MSTIVFPDYDEEGCGLSIGDDTVRADDVEDHDAILDIIAVDADHNQIDMWPDGYNLTLEECKQLRDLLNAVITRHEGK